MLNRIKVISVVSFLILTTFAQAREFQTTNNNKHNHAEIVFNVSDKSIPEQDVKVILAGLEEQVAKGVKYRNGETLQLGFMLTQFSVSDDGRLVLNEPDMKSMPIKYVPTVNNSLKYLRQQKDVVESIGSSELLTYPSILDAIAVHKTYKTASEIMLERVAPEEGQSGWWLHVRGAKPEEFSLVSLYQFAMDRPDLIKYLALPVGAKALDIKGEKIQIFMNDEKLTIKEGSYLAELNTRVKWLPE